MRNLLRWLNDVCKILSAIPVTKQLFLTWDMRKRITCKLCRAYLGLHEGRLWTVVKTLQHQWSTLSFVYIRAWTAVQTILIVDNQRTKHAANEMRLKDIRAQDSIVLTPYGFPSSVTLCLFFFSFMNITTIALSPEQGSILCEVASDKLHVILGLLAIRNRNSYWVIES